MWGLTENQPPFSFQGVVMFKLSKKSKTPANKSKRGVSNVIDMINKRFGENSIITFSNSSINVPTYKTGLKTLDYLFGTTGMPAGRIIELFGPESSGKTSLALHIIAQVQKAGHNAGFVDVEHAFDPRYAKNTFGVDLDNLLFSQPDSAEQALNIVQELCKHCSVVVVDSVAALVPQAEQDNDMEKNHMGLHARLMSKALRKITPIAAKNKCTVIFINQIRMKIGVMFGNPETTTGGTALKYFASIRIEVRKIKSEYGGHQCVVKIPKNKLGEPFRKADLLLNEDGYDLAFDTMIAGEATNVITTVGRKYVFDGETIASSEKELLKYLGKVELRNKVRKKINGVIHGGNSK